ncbi:MAG TPA: tetratricopeptide repeat protein [Nitrospinota bacterium]|nr:tetratricopeptide repeat protein [Nitrospinota bacterium]
MDKKFKISRNTIVCLFLIFATLLVFWQIKNHDFVNYDDNRYITENRHVQGGLTVEGIIWAFTTTYATNWHPLTWLSHMLDISLFGLNPGYHHLMNLLFHIANTLLLFFILRRMTGEVWKSGFVAALFALHPLHVDSVAWIAERKDVLSTFFFMLTLLAYVFYVEKPVFRRYLFVFFFFVFGLLSKPMLVTLPFLLLLLDYWPLSRFESNKDKSKAKIPLHLIWEKIPLFALSFLSSIVTFFARQHGGAVKSLELFLLNIRIENALISYLSYIGKMIWPFNLAVFYPHPGNNLPLLNAFLALLFLLFITVFVMRKIKKLPYLFVGWFWYVGTLVPVIGLIMADRYTYISLIGIFIMIAFGIPDVLKKWQYQRIFLSLSAGGILSILMVLTWIQVGYWKNSITLFEHALNVTSNNYLAHNNLGVVQARRGKLNEAITHYHEALRIKPDDTDTHNNLGFALAQQGKLEEAIFHFKEAIKINPDNEYAQINMGTAMAHQGRLGEAIFHFKEAVRINPDNETTHKNLAVALINQGKIDEAIFHLKEMVRINPDNGTTHNNLGVFLARQGKLKEAIFHFREALKINPEDMEARKNLESIMSTIEDSR